MAVEPRGVHLEQAERLARHLAGDDARAAHLGEVPDPLQEPVGDPRGAARALRDRSLALGLDLDSQDAGRAAHDPRQVAGVVVLEPVADPETVAKRRRQQARAGGGAHQGERRQVEGHGARAGALAEHDGQAPLLHGRIERLLDRAAEAVDLVDEEDRAGLQRGEEGGDVGLSLERRSGGLHQRRAQLGGHDVGERGLAQPGRTGEQHVVERLAAAPGGLDEHLELRRHLLLVDEVAQPLGAKRAVEVLLAAGQAGVGEALLGAVLGAGVGGGLLGLLDPGVTRDAHVLAPLRRRRAEARR